MAKLKLKKKAQKRYKSRGLSRDAKVFRYVLSRYTAESNV